MNFIMCSDILRVRLNSARTGLRGAQQIPVCAKSICSTRQQSRQLGPHGLF